MNVAALKSRLVKLESARLDATKSHYELYRDDFFNLHIKQAANDTKLPIVNLRPYQLDVQKSLFHDGIKRFFLVRPRRAGKEVESWNMLIQGAIERPGLYFMIYPSNVRARAVLWDGAITDLATNTSIPFRDMIPKEMRPKFREDEMKIKFRANGSVIHILGSDTAIDKLRGTNPLGIVFSEFAYSDPRVYQVLNPALIQNGGWCLLQTTFDGMNHAYRLMEQVKGDESWYCRVDSVETLIDENGVRYVTDAMVEQSRRDGMPEYMILQEYYSIVQLNQQSVYFAVEINCAYESQRIRKFAPIPNRPVYSAWDIGINDTNSIWLFQIDDQGNPYSIYYFEDSNKAMKHYVEHQNSWCARHGLFVKANYLPHDGKNRNIQTGISNEKFGQEMGEVFISCPRPATMMQGIELCRRMLYRSYFDTENCARGIECLSNYSKEFDDKLNVWKDQPRHDWASHGTKAFQTLALAIENKLIQSSNSSIIYYNKHDTQNQAKTYVYK